MKTANCLVAFLTGVMLYTAFRQAVLVERVIRRVDAVERGFYYCAARCDNLSTMRRELIESNQYAIAAHNTALLLLDARIKRLEKRDTGVKNTLPPEAHSTGRGYTTNDISKEAFYSVISNLFPSKLLLVPAYVQQGELPE